MGRAVNEFNLKYESETISQFFYIFIDFCQKFTAQGCNVKQLGLTQVSSPTFITSL